MFRGARKVLWKSTMCPLGTLRLSDRSRCGAVRMWMSLVQPSQHFVGVRSLSLWPDAAFSWFCEILVKIFLMSILEGPAMTILQEFQARSCRGPCEQMLWRSWWNPVRGPCMILHRGPCMILPWSLWEYLVETLVRSSKRSLHDLFQVNCEKILWRSW